jgi:hypothetical protein
VSNFSIYLNQLRSDVEWEASRATGCRSPASDSGSALMAAEKKLIKKLIKVITSESQSRVGTETSHPELVFFNNFQFFSSPRTPIAERRVVCSAARVQFARFCS